jgi:hypothetical protein
VNGMRIMEELMPDPDSRRQHPEFDKLRTAFRDDRMGLIGAMRRDLGIPLHVPANKPVTPDSTPSTTAFSAISEQGQ